MKNQASNGNPSTFQELASFLNTLNGSKHKGQPLLKKSDNQGKMLHRLEQQLAAA